MLSLSSLLEFFKRYISPLELEVLGWLWVNIFEKQIPDENESEAAAPAPEETENLAQEEDSNIQPNEDEVEGIEPG